MSDGITARWEGEWQFESLHAKDKTQIKTSKTGRKVQALDEDDLVITDRDGNPIMIDEETIILQRAPVWSLVISRIFYGLTHVSPMNGEFKSVFSMRSSIQDLITINSIGRIGKQCNFVCIDDFPQVRNKITGAGLQRQVWVHIGPWQIVNTEVEFGAKSRWKVANPNPSNFNEGEGEGT